MRNRAGILSCLLAVAGLAFYACDSSNDSPTSPNDSGSLAVQMTDATTDLFSSANVYVKAVTVKPRNSAAVRIANDVGLVNVLELKGTVREIASANVAAGDYEFVQIDFDEARSHVVLKATGTTMPLVMASESVRVDDGFTVQASTRTTVTLDFQADQSFSEMAGGGAFLMAAVVVQVSVQVG
jgi:hypothetical protein